MRSARLLVALCSIPWVWGCGGGLASDTGTTLDADAAPRDAGIRDADLRDADPRDADVRDAEPADTTEPLDGGQLGIGPSGGTVRGPGGAEVIVPAGALSTFVEISIDEVATSTPSFPPSGIDAIGALYAFTPHGRTFDLPVTIRVPFDPRWVPDGATPRLYRAEPGGAFAEVVQATVDDVFLTGMVDGFSYFGPGAPTPELTFSELSRQCAREALGGDVWCWGEQGAIALDSGFAEPAPGQSVFREPTRLPPRALTNVVTGPGWVCGLDVTDVWCIGDAQLTRVAPGPTNPPAREWVRKSLPSGVALSDLVGGGWFVCGIAAPNSPDATKVGFAYCWGNNTFGQLGRALDSDPWEVLPVTTDHRYATLLAAGSFVCGARETTGEVDCWGSNVFGGVAPYALGSYDMTLTPTPRGLTVEPRRGALAGAGANACGMQVDGTTYCWGDNYNGQMGNGTTSPGGQNYRPPTEVTGMKFKSIWPGKTMCGIALDDRAYCWGYAQQGSVGNGADDAGGPPATSSNQTRPVLVAVPMGVTFASMSVSELGRCARSTANEIYCWGPNRFFSLGTGSDMPAWSNVPLQIKSTHLSRKMP